MRVVCPHAGAVHTDTRAVLDHWSHAEYYDVSASDQAYTDLIRQLWSDGVTFCIVEHDVVPSVDVIEEMMFCATGDYCAAPYPWVTHLGPALGCTKFAGSLLADFPDAAEIAARLPSDWGSPGHWRQLDVRLMRSVLRDLYGLQPHCHAPVEHRNPAKQLQAGAIITRTVDLPARLSHRIVEETAAQVAAERAANQAP